MKKIAIIAALTLAIGASMTAGTMARYSQTLDKQTGTVTAKQFIIEDTHNPMVENIKPGESYKYEFTIDNKSEIDVATDINIDLGKSKLLNIIDASWDTKNGIGLYDEEGNEVEIKAGGVTETGYIFKTELAPNTTRTYTIDIPWVAELGEFNPMYKTQAEMDKANTSVQGKSGTISVQITGTQK